MNSLKEPFFGLFYKKGKKSIDTEKKMQKKLLTKYWLRALNILMPFNCISKCIAKWGNKNE